MKVTDKTAPSSARMVWACQSRSIRGVKGFALHHKHSKVQLRVSYFQLGERGHTVDVDSQTALLRPLA